MHWRITVITSSSSSPEAIQPVLDLSNKIFAATDSSGSSPPSLDSSKPYASLMAWQAHLSNPEALLVVATNIGEQSSSSQNMNSGHPVGFIFAFPKRYSELNSGTFHIWLAGVDSGARATGFFKSMMEEVEIHAQKLDLPMSVATVPSRYQRMYEVLKKQGWYEAFWKGNSRKVVLIKGRTTLLKTNKTIT